MINIFKQSPQEQKRKQKCKEIQNYIEYLDLQFKKQQELWENGWGMSDDWKLGTTGYGGISSHDVLNNIEYYRQESIKYSNWLIWWKYTPINDIIKEKGEDYTKW